MKICLIGDFSNNLDEGYKNTSHYLARELAKNHDVVCLNIRQAYKPSFWQQALNCKPQIIHTFTQPTILSLIFSRLLQIRTHSYAVLSALRAERFFQANQPLKFRDNILKFTKPDLILVQGLEAEIYFQKMGCSTAYLANGVDLDRFQPASLSEKALLRNKFDVIIDKPVILHVGHLRDERNLFALEPLVRAGIQVVIAGSIYIPPNEELVKKLKEAGLMIFRGYQPNIEEFYKMADMYIFPAKPGNSLSMPLSVLEAMACNLPIITTRFTGLERAFTENEYFRFIENPSQIISCVQSVLGISNLSTTRNMVTQFSWQAVAERLTSYYEELLSS